ncbi:hypothetical protein T492DRAFT_841338 [Pavlovales sp. CCMP2436]|nr:hypothetical protein T492DRAFT_841338 [Pavlovales sp. CCMP2436]
MSDGDAWAGQLEWPADTNAIGVGLCNAGNSCFVNSVLQCLTHCPPLALGCLQPNHEREPGLPGGLGSARVMAMLCDHIRSALTTDAQAFTPSLASQMHEVSTQLTPGQQEDSHEFLRFLFDAASRQTAAERKAAGGKRPFIESLFFGQMQSTVVCHACGKNHVTNLEIDAELGADGGRGGGNAQTRRGALAASLGGEASCSLMGAMASFLRTEELEAYECERCKAHTRAQKQLRLSTLPPVLLLHLKRFQQNRGGHSKIAGHIPFPATIDFAELRQLSSSPTSSPAPNIVLNTAPSSSNSAANSHTDTRAVSPPHPEAGGTPPPTARRPSSATPPSTAANAPPGSLGTPEPRPRTPPSGLARESCRPERSPSRRRPPAAGTAGAGDEARSHGTGAPEALLRNSAGPTPEEPLEKLLENGGERYVLYGVIVHRGHSLQSGHYLAYVHALANPLAAGDGEREGSWWCFDDANVFEVDEEVVLGQSAYMCFYLRESFWHTAPPMPQPAGAPFSRGGGEGGAQTAEVAHRLWIGANVVLLVCCGCCAYAQLEVLSAETRWSADQLGLLGSQFGTQLWRQLTLSDAAQNLSSLASSSGPDRSSLRTFSEEAVPLSDALPQLAEGLAPVLLLVLLVNFSLKYVLREWDGLGRRARGRSVSYEYD